LTRYADIICKLCIIEQLYILLQGNNHNLQNYRKQCVTYML